MTYDAIIIGGGPGGSAAGSTLALAGKKALILEREKFPRFHIGESLLPCGNDVLRDIGVWDKLAAGGFMPKRGADFVTSNASAAVRSEFGRHMAQKYAQTFHVERSRFDQLLLEHAESLGCEVRQETAVRSVAIRDDGVVVAANGPNGAAEFTARRLIDASGRDSFLGRQLRLAKSDLGMPKKIAAFAHFTGVERCPPPHEGNIVVVRLDAGWFWIIPLDAEKTSVGLVLTLDHLRATGLKPEEAFAKTVEDSSELRRRMAGTERVSAFSFAGDYSYRYLRPVGPRWLLVGDAAGFLDPVFSSGVMLALKSGQLAAKLTIEAGAEPLTAGRQRRYVREVKNMCTRFERMISTFYNNREFEVFMSPDPPKKLARAIVHLVGGDTNPDWRMRIALEKFYAVCTLQRWLPVVPRLHYGEPESSATQAPLPTQV